MSLAYADALTWREDLGGQLGDAEILESASSAAAKADALAAAMLRSSTSSSSPRGVVVFTGAGISVSCGIPDFRGPDGVWTRQRRGLPPPAPSRGVSFATARPSLTHLALAHFVRNGIVTRVVSQNVDGLHLRSGIPRERLFELHGNCFVESCRGCGARHERDFETGTVGFRATGRRCDRCCSSSSSGSASDRRGSGRLYDTVLDWESPLPAKELAQAERDAATAGVSLCLGTSLQISPANSIPERTVTRKGGAAIGEDIEDGEGEASCLPGMLTIVNLQRTPKDKLATSVIRARSDEVMARVLARCFMANPHGEVLQPWERRDRVKVRYELTRLSKKSKKRKTSSSNDGGSGGGGGFLVELAVWVESPHGRERYPLPMVSGVGVAARAMMTDGNSNISSSSDRLHAAAKRKAAREALAAAAEADDEEEFEEREIDEEEEGGTLPLSSVSLPGPSAPFSARLELELEEAGERGGTIVAAVALGLGLGADEDRRRSAVDAAAFAVEVGVETSSGSDPKAQKQNLLLSSGSFDVEFVSQVVDHSARVEEARRQIAAEEEEEEEKKKVKREEENE